MGILVQVISKNYSPTGEKGEHNDLSDVEVWNILLLLLNHKKDR